MRHLGFRPPHRLPARPEPHWHTLLFHRSATTGGTPGAISARTAYQLVLHGRAVLVDLRPDPSGPTVPAALLGRWSGAPGRRVLAIGEGRPDLAVERVDGGIEAWAAAGLPLVTS